MIATASATKSTMAMMTVGTVASIAAGAGAMRAAVDAGTRPAACNKASATSMNETNNIVGAATGAVKKRVFGPNRNEIDHADLVLELTRAYVEADGLKNKAVAVPG